MESDSTDYRGLLYFNRHYGEFSRAGYMMADGGNDADGIQAQLAWLREHSTREDGGYEFIFTR